MARSIYKFIWYQRFFPMTLSITIYLIPTLLSYAMVNYNSSGSHASFSWRGQFTNSSGTNASFPRRCPLQFIWCPRFFLKPWSITIRLVPTLLSHGEVNLHSSGANASFPRRCPLQFIWYPRFFLKPWSITIRLVPTLLSHGDVNLQIHLVPTFLSHGAVHYNLSDTHASF